LYDVVECDVEDDEIEWGGRWRKIIIILPFYSSHLGFATWALTNGKAIVLTDEIYLANGGKSEELKHTFY